MTTATNGNTLTIGGVKAYYFKCQQADFAAKEARERFNTAVQALADVMADLQVGDIVKAKPYSYSREDPRHYRVCHLYGRLNADGSFTVHYRCLEQTKRLTDHGGKSAVTIDRENIIEKVGHRD